MVAGGQKHVFRIFPSGDDKQGRRNALPGLRQRIHLQIGIPAVFFKELVKIRLLIGDSLRKAHLLALLLELP